MDISDLSSSLIVNDIAKMNRRRYEKLLVELELFSEDKLRDEPYSTYKNNRDLAYHTFKEDPFKILEALDREDKLSAETKRALFMDGIEFGNSLAGDTAKPFEESSQLKIILKRLELSQVQDVLEQSLDNYIQGNFEASNAMSRNALEGIIQQIAEKIPNKTGEQLLGSTRDASTEFSQVEDDRQENSKDPKIPDSSGPTEASAAAAAAAAAWATQNPTGGDDRRI